MSDQRKCDCGNSDDDNRWGYIYEILWAAFIAVMIETRNKEQGDEHRSE